MGVGVGDWELGERPCHLATLPPCHLATLPPCHLATLPPCLFAPLRLCAFAPLRPLGYLLMLSRVRIFTKTNVKEADASMPYDKQAVLTKHRLHDEDTGSAREIGRASCRERVESCVV